MTMFEYAGRLLIVDCGMLLGKTNSPGTETGDPPDTNGAVGPSHFVQSTNGGIENLQLVSGHPMLVPAAIAAVKQWRYKPYLLNGQPVEVETTITVIFALTS